MCALPVWECLVRIHRGAASCEERSVRALFPARDTIIGCGHEDAVDSRIC